MYSLIILGLVASASAAAKVYHNGQCPLVKLVDNFNLNGYGNGVLCYEIARYPNDAEWGGQYGSTEYSLQGHTIQIKSCHVSSGRLASSRASPGTTKHQRRKKNFHTPIRW